MFIFKSILCVLLVLAALIDARSRRFPNEFALTLAIASVAFSFCVGGFATCAIAVVRAVAFCAVLFFSEILWRRFFESEGIGAGDLKAAFSLLILSFRAGIAGFCVGLVLLAIVCVARKAESMPALPFIVPSFLAFWLVLGL